MNLNRLEVFLEFLVFGIVIGITEDIMPILLVTGERMTWQVVGLVALVAIPFAVWGELVVDRIDFVKIIKRGFR